MKVYSKIDELPNGIASNKLTEGCLVLEGGAFRGLYTSGVTDALMQNNINLSCTIGVSAGALNGLNYVSGNIGRSARINLRYRHDSRYVGIKAFEHNKGIIGFDFVLDQINSSDPMNLEYFWNPERRFIVEATNCHNGEPSYFEKGKCSNILKGIQASASMPYVSKMVKIDDVPYLDGGCSKAIPYEWALQNDYKKIIVVRTRPLDFRKTDEMMMPAFHVYKNYPMFANSLASSKIEYNRECDEIVKLTEEKRIFTIAPSCPITVSRVESDMEKLGDLYYLGYNDTLACLDDLKKYLFEEK